MGDPTYRERSLRLAYERASDSYEAITEFRAKLLTLLPLATGTGAFLLLQRAENVGENDDVVRGFLGPIGIFGFVVTLGLFAYELRGMQRCHRLEVQLATLERLFRLSPEQGPFLGQPKRKLGNMLGPPAAGLIVYLATAFAWVWLAGYGFGAPLQPTWLLPGLYAAALIVAWFGLSWWLRHSSIGRLPEKWQRLTFELPPMRPFDLPPIRRTYANRRKLAAARIKADGLITKLAAADKKGGRESRKNELAEQLDRAERDYLMVLHVAFLDGRIPAARRNHQPR